MTNMTVYLLIFWLVYGFLEKPCLGLSQVTEETQHKRIIQGHISQPHQWPWHAQLQIAGVTSEGVSWHHMCGGSLIDPEWVATAAHCVVHTDKALLRIKLGEYNIIQRDVSHESEHAILEIHYHELFLKFAPLNDIALLKIFPAAHLSDVVQTIPLPKPFYKVPDGLLCIAEGFSLGKGSVLLRHVELSVVNYKVCQAKNRPYHVSLLKNICAGSKLSLARGCHGDSGGGLICVDSKGDYALQGILSWGSVFCTPRFYSVFTRVSSYIGWIHNKISQ